MNKNAFTLAEVLITLSILGVIAAVTIPSVIHNYQRNILKTQLRIAYSDLEQFNRTFTATHNKNLVKFANSFPSYTGLQDTIPEIIKDDYLKIKTAKAQAGATDLDPTNVYKTLTGNSSEIYNAIFSSGYLIDGKNRVWFFRRNDTNMFVSIDINGIEKKPNRFGEDLFLFYISAETGEVVFHWNYAQTKMCKIGDVGTGGGTADTASWNGLNCTEYAFRDVHPTDSSKKYWTDFLNLRK